MINKQYYGLLFVLGASLLLSLTFCPPYDLIVDDKEFFKYTGMAVLRGNVPYRDFFDHKPPLIYFINAAGLLFGSWGLWLISTILAGTVTWLVYQLGRQYRLAFPWLLPLLFNLMIRDKLISGGMHFTREYSTFFVMLFFCVLMGNYRHRFFLLGLFTALTFFTQQDQVLLLIPFLLYAWLGEKTETPLLRFGRMSTGFLSVLALLLLYFAANHSLSYFWQDAYQFNFSWYLQEKKSIGDHFRTIKRVLDDGNYEIPFMIALILGVIALFLKHKKKILVVLAILAMILSMSSELMGGRYEGKASPQDFIGYFLPLAATVPILLFMIFAFAEDPFLAEKKFQLPFALLLCGSLSYTALQHGFTHERRKDQPQANRPELTYLRQQQLKDYQLFVMLDEEYAYDYNELKILSPTPWLYQQFWIWYANWDADHHILEQISQDLLRHNTTYVISDPKQLDLMRTPANKQWWLSFLKQYYQPIIVPGTSHATLWKKKEPSK